MACFNSDEICVINKCNVINGWSLNTVDINADYTIKSDDVIIFADATSGVINLTLPTTPEFEHQMYMIRKTDATYNEVIISGAALIDGAADYRLARPDEVIYLVYDAGEWKFIVNKTERILTSKGDLLVNNGATAVRQSVGADGLVLTASAASPTGVVWASPGGATSRITYSIVPLQANAINTIYDSIGYFPWNVARHSLYTGGVIVFHAICGNRELSIRFYDITNGVMLGSLTTAVSGSFSFAVSNPLTDAICAVQILKSAANGDHPAVFGVNLEYG